MITIDASVWVSCLDKTDPLHVQTVRFFRQLTAVPIRSRIPSFALVEIACALGRRRRDPRTALEAVRKVRQWPQLEILPATAYLPDASIEHGLKWFLRAGDAAYAACAHLTGTILITWDQELIERAAGITPAEWLTRQAAEDPE